MPTSSCGQPLFWAATNGGSMSKRCISRHLSWPRLACHGGLDPISPTKKCAKALQELEDAKRSEHLGLLAKQGSYLRMLTDDGYRWCETYQTTLSKLYSGGFVPSALSQEAGRVIRDLEKTEVFHRFQQLGRLECDRWELAEAMRCMVDSSSAVWSARLDSVAIAAKANGRQDILEFVEASRTSIGDEGEGEAK